MTKKLNFVSQKKEEIILLPRWAKAFFAARAARRAVELVDGNQVSLGFNNVIKTLDAIEISIQEGSSLSGKRHIDYSSARDYAGSFRKNGSSDYYAALAVDDAFGLMTEIASKGTARENGVEYQLRKLSYAIDGSLRASRSTNREEKLFNALAEDLSKLTKAVKNRNIIGDNEPIPSNILSLHCEIDDTSSLIEVGCLINEKLISLLASNPKNLYELSPRAFEELIAYLFDDFGYDVELTANTRDGGKDIIAICNKPSKQKFLIECKKYAASNTVGIDVVQRLHGVISGDGASNGIIATTSTFTKPAIDYMSKEHIEYRLSGHDFNGIQDWLKDYEQNQRIKNIIGKDFEVRDSGLVVPSNTQ